MAISWGAWEGASPNRIRVGLDVTWEAVSHSEAAATATIKIYTDVEGSWSDSQTISYGGSISGSITFDNNASNRSTLRDTKTYTYNYSSSSYGSSPGSRTFSANLSGAFNGATPSKSVTSNIPARPYGTPAAPTSVNVTRVSPNSSKITWANKSTTGEPWDTVRIQMDGLANDVWNGDIGTTGGGGTNITHSGLTANSLYKWRVRSENSAGNSAWVETGVYYTDPNPPVSVTRTQGSGAQQIVSWANGANSSTPYTTEIWVTRDGGGSWSLLTTRAAGETSYTDTAAVAAQKTGYRARHKITAGEQGTIYSDYSANTTMTVGITSAPNPPIGLDPTDYNMVSPKTATDLTWIFQSTDTSGQRAYRIRWRVLGAPSWTTLSQVVSSTSKHTFAAMALPDNSSIEWQVQTWGAANTGGTDGTGASAYSGSAVFKTVGDPNSLREQKRVVRMDMATGQYETAKIGALPPIGAMMLWPNETPPGGWLIADGSFFDGTAYPGLVGVLGSNLLPRRDDEYLSINDVTSGVVTAASGYSVTAQTLQRHGRMVSFDIRITRTGTNISLTNPEHSNQTIGQLSSDWIPPNSATFATNSGMRHVYISASGSIQVVSGISNASYTNSSINNGDAINFSGVYMLPPPTSAPRHRWIIKAE